MAWAPGRLRGQGQAQRDEVDAAASPQEVFPPALLCAWSRALCPWLSTALDKQGIPALTNPPLSAGKLQTEL